MNEITITLDRFEELICKEHAFEMIKAHVKSDDKTYIDKDLMKALCTVETKGGKKCQNCTNW